MSDIYDQHRAAFANVSAYVVLKDGERVASIAFKFGTTVTAYVHWFGVEMVRGRAGGGGYDRQSAAIADACRKISLSDREDKHRDDLGAPVTDRAEFVDASHDRDGRHWDQRLRDAGFVVFQAV
jgi:hypothetical protein